MSPADLAFHGRILAERTGALARRGADPDEAEEALPPRLVCTTRDRLYGLPPGLVACVLPARCHAVPLLARSAMPAMLGVFGHGGLLYSLIELARLLDGDAAGAGAGGIMLLLQRADRRVALRVDAVLGVSALRACGTDGRHGLLPDSARAAGGRLVSLLDAGMLRDAIAALDGHPADRPPPILTGA